MSRLTKWFAKDDDYGHNSCYRGCESCNGVLCHLAMDMINKLAHYEDLEDEGRLMELPCKLKNAIDVIFSHNEIVTLMCDGVDENGTRCCLHFWHGMAWNIPKEYLELPFVKIHGVVSDKPDTLYVEVYAKFTPEEAEAKLAEMEGAE